jgi:hypothetical protein
MRQKVIFFVEHGQLQSDPFYGNLCSNPKKTIGCKFYIWLKWMDKMHQNYFASKTANAFNGSERFFSPSKALLGIKTFFINLTNSSSIKKAFENRSNLFYLS